MLRVRVLGELAIEVDGAPADLPAGRGARSLLGLLALDPRVRSRSEIAAQLWPDVLDESARTSLRSALSALRRSLEPGAERFLVATRDRVGLTGEVWTDVGAFGHHADDGRLGDAIELYRGDLLAGMDDGWVLATRDEWRERACGVLERLAKDADAAGDTAGALGLTRRIVALDPLSEDGQRALIGRLAGAGDRPAALTAYARYADRLRTELRMAPSAATRALVDELRSDEAAERRVSVQTALPEPLTHTVRPVGREEALERLSAVWEEARSTGLRLALIAGEAGVGKTTLVGEFCRRAHAAGAVVLYGRCDEEPLLPYQPFVEALERHLASLSAGEREALLGVHGGALGRLLPGMGMPGADGDGLAERYLAFEAVRVFVEQTAAEQPVVLVVDDLHWADPATPPLLRHLARMASGARGLIALCVRDAELNAAAAAAIADLRRDRPLLTLALGGLDEDAVAALVAARHGHSDPDAARRLRAQTGGNPFFLEEVLRDGGEHADGRVPPGVGVVVGRRVGRLKPATQDVLALAAVAGLEFDRGDLTVAAAGDPGDVLDALDEAAASGLIAATDSGHRCAFSHALVPEAILAALPHARRARLHLAVADALERRHPADGSRHAVEIARHLRAAGPLVAPERTFVWEVAAARQLSAALAYDQAATHLQAALDAFPTAPAIERGELLLELGGARDRGGHRSAARDAFRAVADLARAEGDGRLLARAALGHGGLGITIAAADADVADLLEQALTLVPDDARELRVRLLTRLAVELFYDDPARAAGLSAAAVSEAREVADGPTLAAALNGRRVVLWSPSHADERLAVSDEMAALTGAPGDRESLLQARNWRILDLLELGRVGEAEVEIDAYAGDAEAFGLPHYRWYVPLWRAGLAVLRGRWRDAAVHSADALTIGARADDPNAAMLVRLQGQCALEAQRRYADMDRAWVDEMASSPSAGAAWATWLAEIDAHTGQTDRARRVVTELSRDGCAALPPDANWHALCDLAEAAATIGDRDAAGVLHPLLAPHARLFPVVARSVACYGSAEYYLGRLAATLGRHDEAERRLQAALEHNDRIGALPRAAVCLVHLADTLDQRGAAGRAREARTEAVGRAEALGMPVLAATATRALGEAR